ncbi:MAG: 30S ribosomal protein S16 [Prevotellaceae bacterium]|jgi:small subunit ribosomal protein S16|nr:30S ribosomal protein S16 [Prevotellaceae bacterium]
MSVKIRLSRHGKKNFAYFHIIIADSRAPRDGRFIERIGSYNPNTNPAAIELDAEKALSWLNKGAQPTDTCRRILSYKGVLLKKHLLEGVKKGALTEETAGQKWEAWMQEKENKVQTKKSELAQAGRSAVKERQEAETKSKEAKAAIVAQKKSEQALKEAETAAAAVAEEEAKEAAAETATPAVEPAEPAVEPAAPDVEPAAPAAEPPAAS